MQKEKDPSNAYYPVIDPIENVQKQWLRMKEKMVLIWSELCINVVSMNGDMFLLNLVPKVVWLENVNQFLSP